MPKKENGTDSSSKKDVQDGTITENALKEKLLSELPKELGDYSMDSFLHAVWEAGWNREEDIPLIKAMAVIIEKAEDKKTAADLIEHGLRDRMRIINSIMETMRKRKIQGLANEYPREFAWFLEAWNLHQPKAKRIRPSWMTQYEAELKAWSSLEKARLKEEQKQVEIEKSAREKPAWIENAKKAGWNLKGDEELLSAVYDARLDQNGKVIQEIDSALKEFHKNTIFGNRSRLLFLFRAKVRVVSGRTKEQEKALGELDKHHAGSNYLGQTRKFEKYNSSEVKDPALAETFSVGRIRYQYEKGRLEELLKENDLSPLAFAKALSERGNKAASDAVSRPGLSKDQDSFARSFIIDNTLDHYSPGEENREERERAEALVDSLIREEMKAFTKLDPVFVSNHEKEKEDYLKAAEEAGWTENLAKDRTFFGILFNTRYDKDGKVIPEIDRAIRDLSFDKNDFRSRKEKKAQYHKILEKIPDKERTPLQEYFIHNILTFNEDQIQAREWYADNAVKQGYFSSKEDMRAVYEFINSLGMTEASEMLYKELRFGNCRTYPNWKVNENSPVLHLQRYDFYTRLRELAERPGDKGPGYEEAKAKALPLLDRLIRENAAEAEKEKAELEKHNADYEKAVNDQAEERKDWILSLSEKDLSDLGKGLGSCYNSESPAAWELGNRGDFLFRNYRVSLQEAKKDFNSPGAFEFKKELYYIGILTDAYLKEANDRQSVPREFIRAATILFPEKIKNWEDSLARRQEEMARQEQKNGNAPEKQVQEQRDQKSGSAKDQDDGNPEIPEEADPEPEVSPEEAQAIRDREKQKEDLMRIFRNLKKVEDLHLIRDNSIQFENMMTAFRDLDWYAHPRRRESYEPYLGLLKDRITEYLSSAGLHTAWRTKGNTRKECAMLALSIADPEMGNDVIRRANRERWKKNHLDLDVLREKPGVGLEAAPAKKLDMNELGKKVGAPIQQKENSHKKKQADKNSRLEGIGPALEGENSVLG